MDIPFPVVAAFKVLAKKCYDEQKRGNEVLTAKDYEGISKDNCLKFGLFVNGPQEGYVVLLHPLFQEHFAGQHLEGDLEAWKMMLDNIKLKLESGCPRPSLEEAVRPLQNVIRFLVGLSPKIAKQIGSLFVIEKYKTSSIFGVSSTAQPVMQYELDLLNECTDKATKSFLAKSIVKAPVVALECSWDQYTMRENHESHDLLPYLTYDERISARSLQLSIVWTRCQPIGVTS